MRAPLAYGYCHEFTGPDGTIGLDLESQRDSITFCFERELQRHGYQWAGFYVDRNESRPFWDRKAGEILYERLRRGDALIIAKADRAFPTESNLVRMLEVWEESGVTVHFADHEFHTTNLPVARLFSVFREFQSARISQQRRETAQRAKRDGQPASGSRPLGLCWKGPRGRKRLNRDEAQREIMGRIVELRRSGMTFEQITLRLEKDGVRHRRASTKKPRPYSKDTVWRMYLQELLLRLLEEKNADFSDPSVVRLVLSYTQNPLEYRDARKQLDARAMAGEL